MRLRVSDIEPGFTMVELVIVVSLLAVLTLILYTTLANLTRGKRVIEEKRVAVQSARYVLSRISNELSSRFNQTLSSELSGDSSNQPDPAGAARSNSFMIGENSNDGDSDTDALRFVTAVGSRSSASTGGGIVEVSYSLRKQQPQMGEHPVQGEPHQTFSLLREERPAGITDNEIQKATASRTIAIAENVVSLNFRFRSRDEWKDEWKAGTFGFPEAVEISVAFRDGAGKLESFRTAVALSRAQGRAGTNPYQLFSN